EFDECRAVLECADPRDVERVVLERGDHAREELHVGLPALHDVEERAGAVDVLREGLGERPPVVRAHRREIALEDAQIAHRNKSVAGSRSVWPTEPSPASARPATQTAGMPASLRIKRPAAAAS